MLLGRRPTTTRRLSLRRRSPRSTLRLGIEHEFVVRLPSGAADFRRLIHGLGLGRSNLDPSDPNAYRLPSGAAVTADGAEAEIALPPIEVRPAFTRELLDRARLERQALARRLPPGHDLEGCSTHISIGVADALEQPICRLYAETFAPALMLLMDRLDSPGLLVRPRPGRVELGGEFVDGESLAAAAIFAIGSVLACVASIERLGARFAGAPARLAATIEPAVARYGWYVDRTAFGGDLYRAGRRASLPLASGGAIDAQQLLNVCWQSARAAVGGLVEPAELGIVDRIVAGERALPSESGPRSAGSGSATAASAPRSPAAMEVAASAYGEALATRRRPVADITPVMLTWQVCVFLLLEPRRGRLAFAAVAGADLPAFLGDLDAGLLDDQIGDHLRRRPSRRSVAPRQVTEPVLFDQLGPRLALLAPELGADGRPLPPVRQVAA